jgi:hypothetical protein
MVDRTRADIGDKMSPRLLRLADIMELIFSLVLQLRELVQG